MTSLFFGLTKKYPTKEESARDSRPVELEATGEPKTEESLRSARSAIFENIVSQRPKHRVE